MILLNNVFPVRAYSSKNSKYKFALILEGYIYLAQKLIEYIITSKKSTKKTLRTKQQAEADMFEVNSITNLLTFII